MSRLHFRLSTWTVTSACFRADRMSALAKPQASSPDDQSLHHHDKKKKKKAKADASAAPIISHGGDGFDDHQETKKSKKAAADSGAANPAASRPGKTPTLLYQGRLAKQESCGR